MTNRKRLSPGQARAIVAVAQSGSMIKAATILNCSQSVISRVISSAEQLVGSALFHRSWNTTRLTAAGETLYPHCKRAVDRIIGIEERLAAETGLRRNLGPFLKWQHLEAVASIVRLGSATRAAKHLASSQPTVSKIVSELAHYANVVLFDRTREGLEPTACAVVIAALHDDLTGDLDVTAVAAQARFVHRGERLSIGISPFGGQRIVSHAIARLMSHNDISHLSTTYGEYDDLCRALRVGEIDCIVGALRGPIASPMLEEVYLYPETFHLFAAERRMVEGVPFGVDQLRKGTWLVGPDGTPARSSFNAFLADQGIDTPDKIFEMYSFADAEDLIDNSESIGVLCYSQRDLARLAPRLRALNFDLPNASAAIGLTLNKDLGPNEILQDFERAIKHTALAELC